MKSSQYCVIIDNLAYSSAGANNPSKFANYWNLKFDLTDTSLLLSPLAAQGDELYENDPTPKPSLNIEGLHHSFLSRLLHD